jgi:hypothetical protein
MLVLRLAGTPGSRASATWRATADEDGNYSPWRYDAARSSSRFLSGDDAVSWERHSLLLYNANHVT